MAIIPQQSLFSWEQVEELGDLERLLLVMESMPDEQLMQKLERKRGYGRDKHPVRGMWNSLLAGIVYQHPSVQSLQRELARNGQLRMLCGLKQVPSSSAYSRFLRALNKHPEDIKQIFDLLLKEISALLPDFGKHLGIDGKAIESHANPSKAEKPEDGRRDRDADFGKKTYRGKREDGTSWEKSVSWYGYRLHLIVDTHYELPVSYLLTKASAAEAPQAHLLLRDLEQHNPTLLKRCYAFSADRGYDDTKLHLKLWDGHGIRPIIDIRNLWKDGEATRLLNGRENVVYDYRGTVYCYCPQEGKKREMPLGGFEEKRGTLKYRCPAESFGISCAGMKKCPVGKAIRIPLSENRRIFTPLARSSYKWKKLYKKRIATERVNSRLDVSFGFENHFIRGQKKMDLRVGMALSVMLALAVGRVKANQNELMRSLVKTA